MIFQIDTEIRLQYNLYSKEHANSKKTKPPAAKHFKMDLELNTYHVKYLEQNKAKLLVAIIIIDI